MHYPSWCCKNSRTWSWEDCAWCWFGKYLAQDWISVIDPPDLSGVMQPRVSLYYSSVSLVTFFALGECPKGWLFKRAPWFLANFLIFQEVILLTDLGWGSWHGVETLHSSWGTFAAEIFLWLLHSLTWVQGPALTESLPFLPVSI